MSNARKVVLITGASAGMGKATAKLLLKEGFTVYAAARRLEQMHDLKALGASVLAMDLTDDETMVRGVEQVIREQGHIDVLFNNAGYGSYGAVEDIPIEEARRQFEVNLFGLGRLTQLVLPHMRKQSSGLIINNSSMGGKIYTPLGAWYHATKHALEGFTDCLRLEVAQFGIKVVLIEPGVIQSEWAGIMLDKMRAASLHTAYKTYTEGVLRFMQNSKDSSPPEVIANVVLQAIRAKDPKTRYVAGALAKQFMMMRKLLPDKVFDKMLNKLVGV